MRELLKEIKELIKDYNESIKYRKQLLKAQLNVDAFEYFLKKSAVTGVSITLEFAEGAKVTISPDSPMQLKTKSFREKFQEAKNNA